MGLAGPLVGSGRAPTGAGRPGWTAAHGETATRSEVQRHAAYPGAVACGVTPRQTFPQWLRVTRVRLMARAARSRAVVANALKRQPTTPAKWSDDDGPRPGCPQPAHVIASCRRPHWSPPSVGTAAPQQEGRASAAQPPPGLIPAGDRAAGVRGRVDRIGSGVTPRSGRRGIGDAVGARGETGGLRARSLLGSRAGRIGHLFGSRLRERRRNVRSRGQRATLSWPYEKTVAVVAHAAI